MNSQLTLPPIGFGTYQLTGQEAQTAIASAIDCGYRLIDTAAAYGNEVAIKRVLRSATIERSELVVSGKLWNTKRQYDDALLACNQSLKRLGLEYFDLYLVHWPASPALYPNWREINAECWRAMETLYHTGLAKAIGVCNFLPHHLDALLETAEICPAVNQIELHPGFFNAELLQYCNRLNISVEAWSPLGQGSLLNNALLLSLAEQYQRSPAQICLRWCVQHNAIPLPKSVNPQRINGNINIFDFVLSDIDMESIDKMPFCGGSGFDSDTITIYG